MATPKTENKFVVGTRKSNLALIQTGHVAEALAAANQTATFPVEHMTTLGDRNQTTPLHLLSPYNSSQPAKSLWTDELESALLDGRFDLLVHSCKDVPTTIREGCEIGALLERHCPYDALVVKRGLPYKSLDDIPDGSIIGTGSVRRVAQLKRAYPKLKFADMRGNLNTRLAKLDAEDSQFVALILAISGMVRLGATHRLTASLTYPVLMHAVGQGALAVEMRSGDAVTRQALRAVSHWQTEWRVGAERGLLRVLEGGCSVPVGVETALTVLPANDASPTHFPTGTFAPLTVSSPTLHFSGLIPPTVPIPAEGDLPPLTARKARLELKACVTSTDGTRHVLYAPGPAIVTSYQEAERWGEECAREIRRLGASEILAEIEAERKSREAETHAAALAAQAAIQATEATGATAVPAAA